MNCNFCNAGIPEGSKYCPECGKSCIIGVDFAYLLDVDSYRSVTSAKIDIPYGRFAVTLIDGKVSNVEKQENYKGNQKNSIVDFLTRVYDASTALIGRQSQEVKTYILLNLEELPIATYSLPIGTPGTLDATLKFNLWVGVGQDQGLNHSYNNLGLFFERCMRDKKSLSLDEFKKIAALNIQNLVDEITTSDLSTGHIRDQISERLLKVSGISSRCSYARGRKQNRRFINVSRYQNSVSCTTAGCDATYLSKINFCESCGKDLTSLDWLSGSAFLQAQNGEEVTLRISLIEDIEDLSASKNDNEIAKIIVQHLETFIRRRTVASLMDSTVLPELTKLMNASILKDFKGYISNFEVVDVRTATEDWFFKTDALINEELRKIESDKRFLAVDDSKTDYMAAAFSMAMRRLKELNSENLIRRKENLESQKENSVTELEEYALNKSIALKKEQIDAAATQEQMLRKGTLDREQSSRRREDEISDIDHQLSLDSRVAKHDLNMADLTGDAQSRSNRREISDESFKQEELIRLEGQKASQLGQIEEDIQDRKSQRDLSKLKSMAEIEANMAKQDYDFELTKLNNMKGLSPQEILAMQAAQLVKSGAPEKADEIVKHIAASNAAMSSEEMYLKMLEVQREASLVAIEGLKEAAKIAQSTNEKSMDSMAKVATASSGRKATKEDSDEPASSVKCKNPECGHSIPLGNDGKVKNICSKCGFTQSES
jgi:hypothetical protein